MRRMSEPWITAMTSLFRLTDEQAMWRVQMHDDAEAFAQLLKRWQAPIERLCTRMIGDGHKGQDLAQETFARIFAKRKHYEPKGRFSTYLWRIALNICHDELRKVRRRGELPFLESGAAEEGEGQGELTIAAEAAPDQMAARGEESEMVRAALMRLSEPYRTVVVLRHYENRKFREIAEILEVPEGTVKSRMAEALSQLRRLLRRTI
jgi:RNA polymerase sigma-70 factor (ECF subfamily)